MSTFKDLLTAANAVEENNLHKNEKIPEVIAAFKKCYDLDPANEETKRKYLSYFKRQFELEHIKKNQEELKVLGNAQVQQDRYEEAVIIYDASIDLDPSIESAAPIYSNRSLAFFNLGRFKEAEDDACMAIFLKPEFARGYLRRGNAAMKLEKWKESLEAYDKYFELDPESAKSDPDLVKNKNSVKKAFEQSEAEMRRHERLMVKTRAELMAIEDETERMMKATNLMNNLLWNPSSFDVDLVRMLVELGADLTPIAADPTLVARGRSSLLLTLLGMRHKVSPKLLPQLDELLFFIIDEMIRRDVAFCGHEVSVACSKASSPLNPKIVRVLLETNKFDVNQSFRRCGTLLISLVEGLMKVPEVPSEALDCLHVLLNWKGIDVNALWRRGKGDSLLENHVLDYVRHPEIARILIRHGANVNQVTASKGPTNINIPHLAGENSSNVLHAALADPSNPHLEELVQLYIRSGARLLANGKDGKSSSTIVLITLPQPHPITKQRVTVSEEVFHVILQLNQQQGLLVRWQDPAVLGDDHPLLHAAVSSWAPPRIVQILCAMFPEQMNETSSYHQSTSPVTTSVLERIQNNDSKFEETMEILGVLLDHGLDLFQPYVGVADCFVALWLTSQVEKCDLNLLKRIIVEKRGEDVFQKCMQYFKAIPASELAILISLCTSSFTEQKKIIEAMEKK